MRSEASLRRTGPKGSPVDRPVLLERQDLHIFQELLLGIVQGLTEFFPVSSSAHLRFARYLMGLSEGPNWIYFDLSCHAGTWFALAFFLRKEIWEVLSDIRKIALYTVALLPLIPAYFLLKSIRAPEYTGYFLLITATLLFLASKKQSVSHQKKWTNVLFVGMMQGLALLPGLSRSGATITAGRFCNWSWIDAARFSFLLAIPTILGGEMLESYKLFKGAAVEIPLRSCAVGLMSSFIVGLFAVRFVFWAYEKEIIRPFAWYCLGFGLLMIGMFHG